jgi:hypothetical protein
MVTAAETAGTRQPGGANQGKDSGATRQQQTGRAGAGVHAEHVANRCEAGSAAATSTKIFVYPQSGPKSSPLEAGRGRGGGG